MITHLATLLGFQLLGEISVRSLNLPLPGPVLGMVLLLLFFMVRPKAAEMMSPTARGLLAHLSLLFVPAGVGVVGHAKSLGSDGPVIILALVLSTTLAIAVAALTFKALTHITGDAGG